MIWLLRALAFACALSIGRADAAVYFLVNGAATTYTTFATCAGQCQKTQIQTGTTGAPASIITPQVVVSAGGACTAQVIGSNDGINWENVGSAISVTTGGGHGGLSSGAALTATWLWWSATITTLTGTGATCTVTASG